DQAQRLRGHGRGQRRVVQRLHLALPCGQGPGQEVDDRLALVLVRLVLVDEDVGRRGDRIRPGCGGVQDVGVGRDGERQAATGGADRVNGWGDIVAPGG